jgi:hypothetical protein
MKTWKVVAGASAGIAALVVLFWPKQAAAAAVALSWKNDGPPTIKPRNQSLTYRGAGNLLAGKSYDEIMNGSAAADVAGELQTDLTDPNAIPLY